MEVNKNISFIKKDIVVIKTIFAILGTLILLGSYILGLIYNEIGIKIATIIGSISCTAIVATLIILLFFWADTDYLVGEK